MVVSVAKGARSEVHQQYARKHDQPANQTLLQSCPTIERLVTAPRWAAHHVGTFWLGFKDDRARGIDDELEERDMSGEQDQGPSEDSR